MKNDVLEIIESAKHTISRFLSLKKARNKKTTLFLRGSG